MILLEALGVAALVALISISGALFFGHSGRLVGIEKFAVPVAVGVFMSIILYELIPETIIAAPETGGLVIALGFIVFYVLANLLHKRFHHLEDEECDRKGAALLVLIGDGIHNVVDGIVIGGAFMVDPALGVATAIGLALHEMPQEIVEFGILMRAGYSRAQAVLLNLLSASSIFVGVILVFVVSNTVGDYVWILTGLAAGNLLFLAASDLLPRIHGNLKNYGSIWHSATSIIVGFVLMTSILNWTHSNFGDAHGHDEDHAVDEHIAEEHGEDEQDH